MTADDDLHCRVITDTEAPIKHATGTVALAMRPDITRLYDERGNGWAAYWSEGFAYVFRLEGGVMTEQLAAAHCRKHQRWDVHFADGKAVIEVH